MIILHSHGGLGNQIFQILAAELFSSKYNIKKIRLYHNNSYSHSFELCDNINIYDMAYGEILFLSKLRLPKIMFRLNFSGNEYLNIGKYFILDGYYQDLPFYQKFSRKIIDSKLLLLRKLLLFNDTKIKKTLYHLRLGDFFLNNELAISYSIKYLEKCEKSSHLITNQEELLNSDSLKKIINNKKIKIIGTKKLKPIELLNLMASYENIISNSSTLAFWASILGNSNLKIKSKRLTKLFNFLKD